jgi:hypothetical protein
LTVPLIIIPAGQTLAHKWAEEQSRQQGLRGPEAAVPELPGEEAAVLRRLTAASGLGAFLVGL